MAKKPKVEVDIAREAVQLASDEITAWEDSLVFITEKVAFHIRNLIRQARKNYWGVFDQAVDPVTGKPKTWVPLTQFLTEQVVKSTDLDQKDVQFRAKYPGAIGLTNLVRHKVKNWLDQHFFGETLDTLGRALAIDGTHVWKTFKENGKMVRKDVDILNFYIEPTADSIQSTPRVYERSLMTPEDFKAMDTWWNKEEIEGQVNLHPTESRLLNAHPVQQQKYVEIYEMWGKVPKSFITGKKADKKETIEAHAVFSKDGSNFQLHFIEENKRKDTEGNIVKPYEEAWLRKVAGRWHGIGVPEMVMMLQQWINMVVNIRINRSILSQMGIFKIRANSNITPQMVGKLGSNGAIVVNDMSDLEQMVIQDIPFSAYKDEENINLWAQRVTSAFETATGERMPASTPATNAVLQNRAAQGMFELMKEGVGMFLQRWMKRHALPILSSQMTTGEIVRMTGDTEEVNILVERIVNELVYERIEELQGLGFEVTEEQVQAERIRALEQLRNRGKDLYVSVLKKIDFSQYDVQVFFTNEEMDMGVMANNLVNAMKIAPELRPVLMRQLFDVMQLDTNPLDRFQQELAQQQQQTQALSEQVQGLEPSRVRPSQARSETEIVQGANTQV